MNIRFKDHYGIYTSKYWSTCYRFPLHLFNSFFMKLNQFHLNEENNHIHTTQTWIFLEWEHSVEGIWPNAKLPLLERIPLLATAAASTTFLQHSWISKLACRSCRIPAEHKNCSFHYYTTENQIVGTSEIPTEMQMWLFLHMWSFWPFLFTGMLCMTYIVIFCEMETLK